MDADLHDRMLDLFAKLVLSTRFAQELTPADLVAPSAELKQVCLWDTFYPRVPLDWKAERENADGTGQYLFDDTENDLWTLWIDYHRFDVDDLDTPSAVEFVSKTLEGLLQERKDDETTLGAEIIPPREGEHFPTGKIIYSSVERDEKLLHSSWHKWALDESILIFAHLTWVVVERVRNEPEIKRLSAMVEREMMNVLVVPHRERAKGDA